MVKIVAEIGLNHDGSLNKAIAMIHEAKKCGAHVAKFQYYLVDVLCLDRNDFNSYDLLKKVCPRPQWMPMLKDVCDSLNIEFACTAFCEFSVEAIAPYVKSFKIASPEVCNVAFVKDVASYGKPLILSTGKAGFDTLDKFKGLENEITLLYCVSKYPANNEDYDMQSIRELKKRYPKWNIGLSDHTKGAYVIKEALKEDISMVEKHFKIDDDCVDAAVSVAPCDFANISKIIKDWDAYR